LISSSLVAGEHQWWNFDATKVNKSCELLILRFGEPSKSELLRDMQEVEQDRSASSDFKGDAAQVQRDPQIF
jgi:hypothetical protein